MNSLELLIVQNHLDPEECMNLLSEAGIISDLAVLPEDVASGDCFRACQFLLREKKLD